MKQPSTTPSVKKHQHIFLLSKMGLKKEVVMKFAGCNAGEIFNTKKAYKADRGKEKEVDALFI